jgi:hypothetical protein
MKITSCVPLPGPGLIARYGALVAVTGGHGPGPDPLLSAVAEVATAAGDGSDLVRLAARAAIGGAGQQAWACAGATADGGVAVLVHGRALAAVRTEDGREVTLTADDSVLPVSRVFAGAAVALTLASGDPGTPDPRFWLGGGVVHGGGLAVTLTADRAGWHPPTVPAPAAGVQPGEAAGGPREDDGPPPVLVEGALCPREHFNDPAARACRECGISLDQPPGNLQRRRRPPLGLLVMDDGTQITLDGDYVIGREPVLDGDVMTGRARPLRIADPAGTVSRLHLKISLAGWQVEVCDLGSANGSVLQSAGGELTLAPFEPAELVPGTWIGIGDRGMQFLSYQGVLP